MKKLFFCIFIVVANSNCGVRGDPLPPINPAPIGRGQPTYQKATEDFPLPEVPAEVYEREEEDEDINDEDEEL